MQILYVEDDAAQIERFQDAVDDWNQNNPEKQIAPVLAKDVVSFVDAIEHRHIDAALLDIKLPETEGARELAIGGNKIAKQSLFGVGIPIAIVSGYPEDIDADLAALNPARFNKGDVDAFQKVLDWLGKQWPMMLALHLTRRRIQALGAEIFVERIWPRWTKYTELRGIKAQDLPEIIARQHVSHAAEKLGLDGEGAVPWHPAEFYVQPALQAERAHTGDLFRMDGRLWIVLTPACDMTNKKVTDVLLCRIEETVPDWNERILSLKDGRSNKTRDYFRRLVTQDVNSSQHFLPPLNDGPPMMVQFKDVATKSLEKLNQKLNDRVASVAPAFLPNLVQRFGAWVSRTGQPDIDIDHFK